MVALNSVFNGMTFDPHTGAFIWQPVPPAAPPRAPSDSSSGSTGEDKLDSGSNSFPDKPKSLDELWPTFTVSTSSHTISRTPSSQNTRSNDESCGCFVLLQKKVSRVWEAMKSVLVNR